MTYMKKKARIIAFYLPQFHPIPENDKWWGKGFTEWRNVGLAKPLFKGHYQPKVPSDLGYYDLRIPEIREQQAALAQEAGIEGFCYWHYWFGNGKELLERPFKEVLESGKPDFPFCLGWANHSWSNKTWTVGRKFSDTMLMEQEYPGEEDYKNHFFSYLKAFKDKRYITVDGKPLFLVFDPLAIKDANLFINTWNKLAKENGLEGFHFVGLTSNFSMKQKIGNHSKYSLSRQEIQPSKFYKQVLDLGFDAVNSRGVTLAEMKTKGFISYYFEKFLKIYLKINIIAKFNYKNIIKYLFVEEDKWENVYPTIIPNWDRSPRSGKRAEIWYNTTPDLFYQHIKKALEIISNKEEEHKILFLQSWNEWGEGNYVEPDCKYGHGYLESIKKALNGE